VLSKSIFRDVFRDALRARAGRQEQSGFVLSFVNKGDVEVGIRRQSDGFRVEGED
jgi:hypothetical protein